MEKLEGKVNWLGSLDEALKKAGSEKKPVFLDFFKEG